jgi:hypothetical protein
VEVFIGRADANRAVEDLVGVIKELLRKVDLEG